jgi:hypothetical protein
MVGDGACYDEMTPLFRSFLLLTFSVVVMFCRLGGWWLLGMRWVHLVRHRRGQEGGGRG